MNKEKLMYTSKQTIVGKNAETKVTKNMNKAFSREQKVNLQEKHEELVVGVSDMNDQIKMEEVIVQGEDQIECPEGCGRKFREDALEKHAAICKKVFQSKRKEYDTKKHRVTTKEQQMLAKKAERQEKVQKNLKNKKPMSKAWKKDSDKLRDFIAKKKDEMIDQPIDEEDDEEGQSLEIAEDDKAQLFIAGTNPLRNESKVRISRDGFSVTEQGGSERNIEEVQNTLQSQIHIKDAGNIAMQDSEANIGGNLTKEQSKKTVMLKNDSVMRNDSVMTNALSTNDPMRIDNESELMMENKIPEKFRKSPIKSKFEKPNSGKSKTISKESEGPCWDLGNQDIELSNSMINHDTFKKNKDQAADPSKELANDSWKPDDDDVASNSFDH